MASFWTSSSINNFFNSSLGTTQNSFYSSLGDLSMIRSGSYKKLMNSYIDSIKSESDSSTSTTKKHQSANSYTYSNDSDTGSKITNKVLDELLSKEPKTSTIKNKVLDDLLSEKYDNKSEDGKVTEITNTDVAVKTSASDSASSYNSDGTKTQTSAATTIDTSI